MKCSRRVMRQAAVTTEQFEAIRMLTVPGMVSRVAVVRMAGAAAIEHDAGVLDATVTEPEQCADGSDTVDRSRMRRASRSNLT